jgi:hypothetical protein
MDEEEKKLAPIWAPRVRRSQIERFYKACGRGVVDEGLIDALGFALYARCESMLGSGLCPQCSAMIERDGSVKNEDLKCKRCAWSCSWKEYRKATKGQLLNPGQIKPFCIEYVQKFKKAKHYGEKIVLIDTLIHRFHGELVGGKKPGAYAFIEGEIGDVAAFLDRLSYGDQMPADLSVRREEWRKRVRNGPKFWSSQMAEQKDENAK